MTAELLESSSVPKNGNRSEHVFLQYMFPWTDCCPSFHAPKPTDSPDNPTFTISGIFFPGRTFAGMNSIDVFETGKSIDRYAAAWLRGGCDLQCFLYIVAKDRYLHNGTHNKKKHVLKDGFHRDHSYKYYFQSSSYFRLRVLYSCWRSIICSF